VVISLFLLAPLMPLTVYLFAAAMGVLWLSTVPLTNGIIAGVFGVKHMSMLAGIVFFSHQVGSFLGVWLGGYLYTSTGSYDMVWGIAIALGVMSGLINLPINERPLVRGRRHDENWLLRGAIAIVLALVFARICSRSSWSIWRTGSTSVLSGHSALGCM
jgi:MFS family permease